MKVTKTLVAILFGVLFLMATPADAQSITAQDYYAYQDSSAYGASAYTAGYTKDRVGDLLSNAMPGVIGAAAGGLIGFKFGGMMGAVVGGLGGFIAGQLVSGSLGLGDASSNSMYSAASQIHPYGSDVYSQYGSADLTGASASYGLDGAYGSTYDSYYDAYDPYGAYSSATASALIDDPSLVGASDDFQPLAPSTSSSARQDRHVRFLERFDTNGNGQMDSDERAAAQAHFMSRMDTDKDGSVSAAEKEAFRNARRERHASDATPGVKEAREAFRQAFTAYQEALKAGSAATAERAAFEAAREKLHSLFREHRVTAEE